MMRKPIFQGVGSPVRRSLRQFGGLCLTEEIAEYEASDMLCGSSRAFPCFAPARGRKEICRTDGIECAIAPRLIPGKELSSFTGVASDVFYYEGEEKLILTPQERGRSLVDFNGNILIFPDKKYYSYVEDEGGEICASVSGKVGFEFDEEKKENRLTFSDGFSGAFQKGDSLSISCTEESNGTNAVSSKYEQAAEGEIVSCIVSRVISDTELLVLCYDRDGEPLYFTDGEFDDTTVSRAMPDIVFACVANNRVFGVDGFGEMIYASKLGDFKNWNVFEGLSTDSWFGSVGTEGPFTALCPLGSGMAAFKHNYIHQLYGETPNNFSIPKQISGGCIDGRSVASIRGQIFYLSYDGVYVYAGGNPVKISSPLSLVAEEGVAGTDGVRYFLSARTRQGAEMFVYDTERGLWHKEDDFSAVSFVRYNDSLYTVDAGALYEIGAGEIGEWFWQSKRFDEMDIDESGTVNLYIKAELCEGSRMRVFVSSDGEERKLCATVSYSGRAAVRVPVRFRASENYQIRIEGTGDARILEIERVILRGGRNETARTRRG